MTADDKLRRNNSNTNIAIRVATGLLVLLILKTLVFVLLGYRDYFPPNFRADFLLGREGHFFGSYQWAFYVHILAGPFCLFSGLVLLNDRWRNRFLRLHLCLGRLHVFLVLFAIVPSGLIMARYAMTGAVAGVAFALLAVVTGFCAAAGWRAAVQRNFAGHRRWMLRSYVLLCSAVLLRVFGGLAYVLGVEGTYPYVAWLSWLLPWAALEVSFLCRRVAITRPQSTSPAVRSAAYRA